jgi:hypothetical protein
MSDWGGEKTQLITIAIPYIKGVSEKLRQH